MKKGLGYKQEEFFIKLMWLSFWLNSRGYRARAKHLMRCKDCKVGKKNSVHKVSLAIDIRIMWRQVGASKESKLIKVKPKEELEILARAHNYWDTLGGAKRIKHDLGHFSVSHKGMR